MIRALVVDDESVARRRIVRLLSERDDVQVVGEASGGRAAVAAINELQPDLVFLDVQMPDITGFDVLLAIDADKLPAVVFTTAYDQYAVRAFEACAVDYLLKPYDADRFAGAVERAARWISTNPAPGNEDKLRDLLREVLQHERMAGGPEPARGRLDRFMIKERERTQFIRAESVDWIEADGNYVRLHVGSANHLVRSTLASCAERLDPRRFVRVHRRYIVNLDRVKEVQPWFAGDHVIVLQDGRKIRLSRSYREHFESRMLGD